MFSCLQILEAFLWFVLITLLNVTLIILTLSVSRLLNLLLRLRSEERFSRNAETELVCRLLLDNILRFFIRIRNPSKLLQNAGSSLLVQTCSIALFAGINQ